MLRIFVTIALFWSFTTASTPADKQLDSLSFDIYQYNDELQHLPYDRGEVLEKMICGDLITESDYESKIIWRDMCKSYMRRIGALQKTFYHIDLHAADVTQFLHLLMNAPVLEEIGVNYERYEKLAALYAAAVHDVDHDGYNNEFLVKSSSDLAAMYKNDAVLEHHSLEVAFRIAQRGYGDIQNGAYMHHTLFKGEKTRLRQMNRQVIDMVLATDMDRDKTLLSAFKRLVKKKEAGKFTKYKIRKRERQLLLKVMLHMANIGTPTRPLETYKKSAKWIMQEFWRQAEREKAEGLPVCFVCSQTLAEAQTDFIAHVVRPWFEAWAEFNSGDPVANEMLKNLETNYKHYLKMKQDEKP